jgi:hypothetical protein
MSTEDDASSDSASSVGIASEASSRPGDEAMRSSRSLRLDTDGNDYCESPLIFQMSFQLNNLSQ